MKLTAQIIVEDDLHNIERLFSSEEKNFANERASYNLKNDQGKIIISIAAQDSSALRAVVTSITKLLSVYEKTKTIIEEE